MSAKTKRCLHLAGGALAVTSLIFVARRLWLYAGQMDLAARPASVWITMGVLGIAYSVANFCLPRLWSACLRAQGQYLPPQKATAIYGYSQISKYLPGNIVHLAGRQALAMAENLPGKAVAASILFEMLLLAIIASCVFLPPTLIQFLRPEWPSAVVPGVLVFACMAALVGVRRLMDSHMCIGVVWGLLFFFSMAAIWAIALATVTNQYISIHWLGISAIWYVVAWLIGFVTPGAPAGLGMREAAMLLLAKNSPIPESDLLLTCLCCRGISVLGDVGFLLISVQRSLTRAKKTI